MAVIQLPSNGYFGKMTWSQKRNDVNYSSAFGRQSIVSGVPQWVVSVEAPPMTEQASGAWKAWVTQLRGSINQAALYDENRPAPLGTMRGSPTFQMGAAQGDVVLYIAAGVSNANATLLMGDLIGFGSGVTQQVVMVAADMVFDASGNGQVQVEPPVRNAMTAGSAIAWDKPCALFRMQTQQPSWSYQPGKITTGFAIDFVESWQP